MIFRIPIVVLSLAGLADALYFTFAYYGRIKRARWVPEILCAPEGSSCVTVLQTPYAGVFGAPNSLFGAMYYLALIVWALGRRDLAAAVPWLVWIIILMSAGTVILGFYLIYALRRILHTNCPLCYAAHAINVALLVLLILLA